MVSGGLHTQLHGFLFHLVGGHEVCLCPRWGSRWGPFVEKVCQSGALFPGALLFCCFGFESHRGGLGGNRRRVKICLRQLLPGETWEKNRAKNVISHKDARRNSRENRKDTQRKNIIFYIICRCSTYVGGDANVTIEQITDNLPTKCQIEKYECFGILHTSNHPALFLLWMCMGWWDERDCAPTWETGRGRGVERSPVGCNLVNVESKQTGRVVARPLWHYKVESMRCAMLRFPYRGSFHSSFVCTSAPKSTLIT